MSIRTTATTNKHIFLLQGLGRVRFASSFIVLRADGQSLTLSFCRLTLQNNNVGLKEIDWILSDIVYHKFLYFLYPYTFSEINQIDFTKICDEVVYFEK